MPSVLECVSLCFVQTSVRDPARVRSTRVNSSVLFVLCIWKLSFADDVNFSFVACKNVPADRNANFHRAFRLRKMLGFLAFLLHLLGKLALSYVTMACDIQDGVLSLCASWTSCLRSMWVEFSVELVSLRDGCFQNESSQNINSQSRGPCKWDWKGNSHFRVKKSSLEKLALFVSSIILKIKQPKLKSGILFIAGIAE